MKKLFFLLLLSCLGIVTLQAQSITKPTKGTRLFELSASGLDNLGAGLNTTRGGLMVRDFVSNKRARRIAANLNLTFKTDSPEIKKFNEISFLYGIENHTKGSSRMSTYWGYAGGLNMASTDNISLTGGVYTGFDFYLADGLYIGTEVGYNALIDLIKGGESAFGLYLPGAAMNGALRLGYRF